MDILKNIHVVRDRIKKAALSVGRDPSEITLIGVTKKKSVKLIQEAADNNLLNFGENYVQEAREKVSKINGEVTWHFIGRLQTNKAKYVVSLFDIIHSVDSLKLANEINKQAQKSNKHINILLEVNLAEEETKAGFSDETIFSAIEDIADLPYINIHGLMTMPPFFNDPEKARPYFKKLKELRDSINRSLKNTRPLQHLSMGMSNDYEVAVQEGATIVRIGTAIFGQRF